LPLCSLPDPVFAESLGLTCMRSSGVEAGESESPVNDTSSFEPQAARRERDRPLADAAIFTV